MENRSRLAVVYNSGLNVWGSSHLSTLAIFYDQVFLPWTTRASCGELVGFARSKGKTGDYRLETIFVTLKFTDRNGREWIAHDFALDWEQKHKILFQEKVLARVPPTSAPAVNESGWFNNTSINKLADLLLDVPHVLHATGGDSERIFVWQDHLKHLLRTDIGERAVFLARPAASQRERYKALMAHAVFRFMLPQLQELHPEQILEVRNLVKDTREGFAMHLQALSSDVEKQVKAGASLPDIRAYAESIVETQLIPGFSEYRRQLAAKRAGFWREVLDPLGKIVQIDAAPWTPKFYGELLRALGITLLTGAEDQQDRLSNRTQAFQFMKTIDEWSNKAVQRTGARGARSGH
jgi:hypothetical protein